AQGHDTHTKCASTESVPALAEGAAIKLAKPNWLTDLPLPEKAEDRVACSARFTAAWCGLQAVDTVFTPGALSACAVDLFRYYVRTIHSLPYHFFAGLASCQRETSPPTSERRRPQNPHASDKTQRTREPPAPSTVCNWWRLPPFFDSDLAIFGRRRQVDRRKGA